MKRKVITILASVSVGLIAIATAVPISYSVSNHTNSNSGYDSDNDSNNFPNQNNSNNGSNQNNIDPNWNSNWTPVTYANKANPINDGGGAHMFAKYDSRSNSLIPSVGPKGVTPSPGVPKNSGFSRNYLYNETQVKQAKRTVGIGFIRSKGMGINSGTGWILDYKLTQDSSSYPLTWYFATNAHVIQNLRVKNDIVTPERYENIENSTYNTEQIKFTSLKDYPMDTNLDFYHEYSYLTPKLDSNGVSNVRTVMIGNDFLKTSPSYFSKYEKYQKFEEYADFAVMEVTFDDEQQARKVTNNYADDKTNQFKYKKQSLLAHPEDIKPNNYSIVGFPAIDPIKNYAWSNIAVNRPDNPTEEQKKELSSLASTGFYNTYKDKVGVFDATIGLSFFTTTYSVQPTTFKEENYLPWGLLYPTDYSALTQGSSGSMMMDKDGYTWGIHFLIDPDASVSFSQALYSEGFNYGGAFGKYNLEGYDLIDGGFINQKKSYRDGLIQLYGKDSSFKTNLYPNGINRN